MKFSNTLEAMMLPAWQQYYIDYKALKKLLKQAVSEHEHGVDFIASTPHTTSLSVARNALAASAIAEAPGTPAHKLLQQQQQQDNSYPNSSNARVNVQGHAAAVYREREQQSGNRKPSFAVALLPSSSAQEQFLQLLQHELTKVQDFIHSQASQLSTALEALAAAAPQLAAAAWKDLEAQARDLGQQLLALEGFVQLNQAGFVKIVKKHDKCLPESPIWHLYLHHLLRNPWLDEHQQQYMWAALSSCYYHLHASMIHGRRRMRGSSSSSRRQQRLQGSSGDQRQQQQSGSRQDSSSSGRGLGGILPALGSAVTAAAAGVTGAAAAAVSAVTSPTAIVTTAAAVAPPAADLHSVNMGTETVKLVRKFWVAQENVSAITYLILQHLPLLPSTAYADSSGSSTWQQQQPEFGASRAPSKSPSALKDLDLHQQQRPPPSQQQQQQQLPVKLKQQQQQQQQPQHLQESLHQRQQQPQTLQDQLTLQQPQRRRQELSGFTTTLHTVYFDNQALELYHGRLYMRPLTQTLKARWISREGAQSGSCHNGVSDVLRDNGSDIYPDKVVLERKVYREGWKGERNIKDSLLIAGERLPAYLSGAYSLSDALQQLYQYPALRQQLQQQEQKEEETAAQQQQQHQQQEQSPFALYASAAESGVVAGSLQQQQQIEMKDPAAAAASIRIPQGIVLGTSSGGSGYQAAAAAAASQPEIQPFSSLSSLAQDHQQQQQQQQQEQGNTTPRKGVSPALDDPSPQRFGGLSAQFKVAKVESTYDSVRSDSPGFEDAYLDPPMPSSDQLSLFTEIQRLVTQKGLGPVLHCVVQRMLFAMPFDDRIKIILDTDVRMSAVVEDDLQMMQSVSNYADMAQQRYSSSGGGSAGHPQQQHQQQQQQHELPPYSAATSAGAAASFDVPSARVAAAMAAAEADAYATWRNIFGNDHNSRRSSYMNVSGCSTPSHGSPLLRYSVAAAATRGHLVYGMPYALLKVSLEVPAGQNAIPGWLQQLVDSDALTPVEDWSKFVHGCSVLMPELVRAVPYWIDDPLVDMSVQNIQAELDAQMARRDEAMRAASLSRHIRSSSTLSGEQISQQNSVQPDALATSASRVFSRIASGINQLIPGSAPAHSENVRHSTSDPGFGGEAGLRPGSFPRTLTRGSSGRSVSDPSAGAAAAADIAIDSPAMQSGSSRLRHSSTGAQPDDAQQQQQQQQHSYGRSISATVAHASQGISALGTVPSGTSEARPVSLHANAAAAAAGNGGSRGVTWADDGSPVTSLPLISTQRQHGSSNSLHSLIQQQRHSSSGQMIRRISSLVRRPEKPQPLFRPEGRGQLTPRRFKRWGHPVQLIECQEFFHSESIFLDWLRLAITMASVAIVLLGFSAMAYVNPLKRPALHVAEIITLLLLPTSCAMVGYAIRVYIWRGKRLHSMRYKRIDDPVGPLLMMLVFISAMVAILLVNVVDLYQLLKYEEKQSGEDGGDVVPGDIPEAYY